MDKQYRDAVALLLDVAPLVFQHPCFALKGGTAINLFVRDLPRLSVDLDLVFVDPEFPQRDAALATISATLKTISAELKKRLGVKVRESTSGSTWESKLFISRGPVLVKVEVNHVFRGSVYPLVEGELIEAAQEIFEREIIVPMLDPEELYASKLVAALDRQHPRDLFDVLLMFENEGITQRMRRAFVVYLAGHNRPMHELLPPQSHDISETYEKEFVGMTVRDVPLAKLEVTRERLFDELPMALDAAERKFLLSMHRLDPDWTLLGIDGIEHLPALKWKMLNLEKLYRENRGKFDQMLAALEKALARS